VKTFLLTAFLSCTLLAVKAQNQYYMETNQQESVAITKVLEDVYLKGIYEGDIELLRKAFHPGTLMFGDIQGLAYAKTLEQYLEGVKNRVSVKHSGKPFKGVITSITIVNSIAVAKLHVKMYDFNYDEFLSFHKIDGQWFIVNKMLTDVAE
jgi:uncharacterized membrane protein YiaA